MLIPPISIATHHYSLHLNSILNSRQQRLRIRTNNLLHLLLILKDQEGRHSSDAQLLCHVWDFINV
jgi:hypothetical protein